MCIKQGKSTDGSNKNKTNAKMISPTSAVDTTTMSSSSSSSDHSIPSSSSSSILKYIWPVHPAIVLATIPFLPTYFYLNRGFTQWFHWMGIFYALTQSKFIEKVLIVEGISVCLGWYAALSYEYIYYGRFCEVLYKNMPPDMVNQMIKMTLPAAIEDDGSSIIPGTCTNHMDFASLTSISFMVLAHVIDMLGHPLVTYYFWKRHVRRGRVQGNGDGTFEDVITWPVIAATYLYARSWSALHTYYNLGQVGYAYVGHHVYVLDDLSTWYPAYVSETIFLSMIILWKLVTMMTMTKQTKDTTSVSTTPTTATTVENVSMINQTLPKDYGNKHGNSKDNDKYYNDNRVPNLRFSESSISVYSTK